MIRQQTQRKIREKYTEKWQVFKNYAESHKFKKEKPKNLIHWGQISSFWASFQACCEP